MERKLQDFHEIFARSCLEGLFLLPGKWAERKPNLAQGDLVFMVKESLGGKTFKWGMVERLYEDDMGVVRTVDVRYHLINVGPVETASIYRRGNKMKIKRCAVQNLSLAYSRREQEEDAAAGSLPAKILCVNSAGEPVDSVLANNPNDLRKSSYLDSSAPEEGLHGREAPGTSIDEGTK